MVLGITGFSVMDAIVKLLVADYNIWQIACLRLGFALLVIIPFVLFRGGLQALKINKVSTHLYRVALWLAAVWLYFSGYRELPLPEAIALSFAAPLMMAMLSRFLLKEAVGWRRWSSIFVGFLGVVIIVRPGAEAFDPGSLYILGGCFTYALFAINTRQQRVRENFSALALYANLGAFTASLMIQPLVWQPMGLNDWFWGMMAGLIGGSAYLAVSHAFQKAPTSVVAPFEYLSLLWASLLGYLIWGDVLDGYAIFGSAIVIGSGLYILYRETLLHREQQAIKDGL